MIDAVQEAKLAVEFSQRVCELWEKAATDDSQLEVLYEALARGKTCLAIQPGQCAKHGWNARYTELIADHVCRTVLAQETCEAVTEEELNALPKDFRQEFQTLFMDGQRRYTKQIRCVYEHIQLMFQFEKAMALYASIGKLEIPQVAKPKKQTWQEVLGQIKPDAKKQMTLDVFDNKISWLATLLCAFQHQEAAVASQTPDDALTIRIPTALIDPHLDNPRRAVMMTYLYYVHRDRMRKDLTSSKAQQTRFYPLGMQKGAMGMYLGHNKELLNMFTSSIGRYQKEEAFFVLDTWVGSGKKEPSFALSREAFHCFEAAANANEMPENCLEVTESENPCAVMEAVSAYVNEKLDTAKLISAALVVLYDEWLKLEGKPLRLDIAQTMKREEWKWMIRSMCSAIVKDIESEKIGPADSMTKKRTKLIEIAKKEIRAIIAGEPEKSYPIGTLVIQDFKTHKNGVANVTYVLEKSPQA